MSQQPIVAHMFSPTSSHSFHSSATPLASSSSFSFPSPMSPVRSSTPSALSSTGSSAHTTSSARSNSMEPHALTHSFSHSSPFLVAAPLRASTTSLSSPSPSPSPSAPSPSPAATTSTSSASSPPSTPWTHNHSIYSLALASPLQSSSPAPSPSPTPPQPLPSAPVSYFQHLQHHQLFQLQHQQQWYAHQQQQRQSAWLNYLSSTASPNIPSFTSTSPDTWHPAHSLTLTWPPTMPPPASHHAIMPSGAPSLSASPPSPVASQLLSLFASLQHLHSFKCSHRYVSCTPHPVRQADTVFHYRLKRAGASPPPQLDSHVSDVHPAALPFAQSNKQQGPGDNNTATSATSADATTAISKVPRRKRRKWGPPHLLYGYKPRQYAPSFHLFPNVSHHLLRFCSAPPPPPPCDICYSALSSHRCADCDVVVCSSLPYRCTRNLHQHIVPTTLHSLKPLPTRYQFAMCQLCQEQLASTRCDECDLYLCSSSLCAQEIHAAAALQSHELLTINHALLDLKPQVTSYFPLCQVCAENTASLYCPTCDVFMCTLSMCDTALHHPASMQSHTSSFVPVAVKHALCDVCSEAPATLWCAACSLQLCVANHCDSELHSSSHCNSHTRVPLANKHLAPIKRVYTVEELQAIDDARKAVAARGDLVIDPSNTYGLTCRACGTPNLITAVECVSCGFPTSKWDIERLPDNVFKCLVEGLDIGCKVLYRDIDFIVFDDKFPIAEHHIQVIPTKVITDISELSDQHISILQHMLELGKQELLSRDIPWLANQNIDDFLIIGFNYPATIPHLHLHLVLPPLLRTDVFQHPRWHCYRKCIDDLNQHNTIQLYIDHPNETEGEAEYEDAMDKDRRARALQLQLKNKAPARFTFIKEPKCNICEAFTARWWCQDCQLHLCDINDNKCDWEIHCNDKLSHHIRIDLDNPPPKPPSMLCEVCESSPSSFYCYQCSLHLCGGEGTFYCEAKIHNKPNTAPHIRIPYPPTTQDEENYKRALQGKGHETLEKIEKKKLGSTPASASRSTVNSSKNSPIKEGDESAPRSRSPRVSSAGAVDPIELMNELAALRAQQKCLQASHQLARLSPRTAAVAHRQYQIDMHTIQHRIQELVQQLETMEHVRVNTLPSSRTSRRGSARRRSSSLDGDRQPFDLTGLSSNISISAQRNNDRRQHLDFYQDDDERSHHTMSTSSSTHQLQLDLTSLLNSDGAKHRRVTHSNSERELSSSHRRSRSVSSSTHNLFSTFDPRTASSPTPPLVSERLYVPPPMSAFRVKKKQQWIKLHKTLPPEQTPAEGATGSEPFTYSIETDPARRQTVLSPNISRRATYSAATATTSSKPDPFARLAAGLSSTTPTAYIPYVRHMAHDINNSQVSSAYHPVLPGAVTITHRRKRHSRSRSATRWIEPDEPYTFEATHPFFLVTTHTAKPAHNPNYSSPLSDNANFSPTPIGAPVTVLRPPSRSVSPTTQRSRRASFSAHNNNDAASFSHVHFPTGNTSDVEANESSNPSRSHSSSQLPLSTATTAPPSSSASTRRLGDTTGNEELDDEVVYQIDSVRAKYQPERIERMKVFEKLKKEQAEKALTEQRERELSDRVRELQTAEREKRVEIHDIEVSTPSHARAQTLAAMTPRSVRASKSPFTFANIPPSLASPPATPRAAPHTISSDALDMAIAPEATLCQSCFIQPLSMLCTQCEMAFCSTCDARRHRDEHTKSHMRTKINVQADNDEINNLFASPRSSNNLASPSSSASSPLRLPHLTSSPSTPRVSVPPPVMSPGPLSPRAPATPSSAARAGKVHTCQVCQRAHASVFCSQCAAYICDSNQCNQKVHSVTSTKHHNRKTLFR